MKDPSREVYIPAPPKPKTLAAPRDMIPNVQGSSAGAGESDAGEHKKLYLGRLPELEAQTSGITTRVLILALSAGSGEFHVYKQARRREYERLKLMEEEDAKVRLAFLPWMD